MNIIYIKLGIGTNFYDNMRLGLNMTLDLPVAAANYDDMDSNMVGALITLVIVQISENEYYTIIKSLVIDPPVTVSTNYLITLSNYLSSCPNPGDAFFILRAGVFFKISWASLKNCLNASNIIPLLGSSFTLGGAPSSTHYTNANLLGKDLLIFVNAANRYINDDEWEFTATGINVLMEGFDAVADPTQKVIITSLTN